MGEVAIRFYGELNDFLSPVRRGRALIRGLVTPTTVKDLVESFGIPHTEVDVILVDGESVSFDRRVSGGERVAVYPVFESFDVRPLTRLRPQPLRETRFVADGHLGRLARYLRLLGFDTWYESSADDAELARRSRDERRVLLTRDRKLLMRNAVTHGLCVRSDDTMTQLRDVVRRLDLTGSIAAFTRCMACNGPLEKVSDASVADQVPAGTRGMHHDFRRCRDCGRIYWPGTHHVRLRGIVSDAVRHS